MIGTLVHFVTESHFFERLFSSLYTFLAADACDRKRKFHVSQHRLVGNEVIRLKDKPDTVISVNVPISVRKVFCGLSLNNKIAFGVVIESADDIKHRRFTAAGLPEDPDEFVFAKTQIHAFKRVNLCIGDFIVFFDTD